jgi:hypothetical protein
MYKLTSSMRLLFTDAKMKYMIPVNSAFGFAAGFLGAFVTGQVLGPSGKDTYERKRAKRAPSEASAERAQRKCPSAGERVGGDCVSGGGG